MAKKEKYIKVKHYKKSVYYTVQFDYDSMGKKCSYSKTFLQHNDRVWYWFR